jgi:putative DNA primase/helicase
MNYVSIEGLEAPGGVPKLGTDFPDAKRHEAPAFISWGPYTMSETGLSFDKDGERLRVAGTFEILGRARDPESMSWSRFLRWRDPDGREHTRLVPDSALHGEAASLCGLLAGEGLRIEPGQERKLAGYLAGCNTAQRVTIVSRTGWHEIAGRPVFVLPSNALGCNEGERVALHGVGSAGVAYEARGMLTHWQAGIGALAADHALPALAVSAALAGPLLYLAGQEGGGLNFYGPSSKGKTTLLQCAASVWGVGGSPGFVRAWRATANGLEGAAAASTDTALILDELGQVDGRDLSAALYSLSNGSGKSRAARDGSLRDPKTWRVIVISSGEIPTEGKLTEERGRRAHAGQLVRLLDVPIDKGRGFGAFDDGGPDGDAGKLAQRFKLAASKACGTAGPEFVRLLLAERVTPDAMRASVSEFVANHVPDGADGQIERAAQRFGLIATAGELATVLGVTPWSAGHVTDAAAWALGQWIAMRGGTASAETRQAIEQVRHALEQHGESRFEPLDEADARPVPNRLGWRKGSGAEREWLIPSETWKREICAGLDAKLAARTLADAGMLERAGDGLQCVRRVKGQNVRCYVLNASLFEGGGDAS